MVVSKAGMTGRQDRTAYLHMNVLLYHDKELLVTQPWCSRLTVLPKIKIAEFAVKLPGCHRGQIAQGFLLAVNLVYP